MEISAFSVLHQFKQNIFGFGRTKGTFKDIPLELNKLG